MDPDLKVDAVTVRLREITAILENGDSLLMREGQMLVTEALREITSALELLNSR